MSTTILTDEQIDATLESLDCLFWDVSEGATHDFARAIEQAVLQSEQVQAWKKDAERYRWLRKPDSNVPITHDAARDPDVYDAAIDAAMEKQP